ncbi:MAG: hypothetical protein ACE5KD_02675 [Candidatus Bathyarchaeia archaeon]
MRNGIWGARGRPKGNYPPRSDARALEYLVKLSIKNQIDATEFFNAFVHAWENGEAICRGLTIQARIRKNDRCIFLITKGHVVVAQFPILERILRDPNPLDRLGYLLKSVTRVSEMRDRKAPNTGLVQIKDLKAGMKGVSLRAWVIEVSRPKLVLTRLNEYALLATATLFDKNSTIKVPLWNQRIHSISVNDKVQIDNAKVTMFRGERQLKIGRNGKLKVIESNSSHAAASTIEYLVK